MKHIDLFSGIGGFSLAASWAGFETILFCDNNKFCQELLKRRFNGEVITDTESNVPYFTKTEQRKGELEGCNKFRRCNSFCKSVPIYGDIRDVDGTKFRGATLLTGGFPCQPFSQAGKRKGKEDDRYLWDEMFRVIREAQPKWVLAENVYGLLTIDNGLVFNKVLSDLESIGYEVQPLIIPACAVNAPHRRDRVWIVAKNTINSRNGGRGNGDTTRRKCSLQIKRPSSNATDSQSGQSRKQTEPEGQEDISGGDKETFAHGKHERLERWKFNKGQGLLGQHSRNRSNEGTSWEQNWIEVATELCGIHDGLPAELDGLKLSKSKHREERLKALGNAIVPQVAYKIIKAIADYEVKNVE